jgi:serine/threonine-protein kinase RsbW
MSGMPQEWTFGAVDKTPGDARRAIHDFVGDQEVEASTLDSIALCVTEAVTNAVIHAYGRERSGSVLMRAEIADRALRVLIRDSGDGMEPRRRSQGLGLGLPLMRQLTTTVAFVPMAAGGTEVTMDFALGTRPA